MPALSNNSNHECQDSGHRQEAKQFVFEMPELLGWFMDGLEHYREYLLEMAGDCDEPSYEEEADRLKDALKSFKEMGSSTLHGPVVGYYCLGKHEDKHLRMEIRLAAPEEMSEDEPQKEVLLELKPRMLEFVTDLGAELVAGGTIEFVKWAEAVVRQCGARIWPYLKPAYEALLADPKLAKYHDEMTPMEKVNSLTQADVDRIFTKEDSRSS